MASGIISMLSSLNAVQSATSLISSGISGVQSGISKIGTIVRNVFQGINEAALKLFSKIRKFYDEHIGPIFDPLLIMAQNIFLQILEFIIKQVSKISDVIKGIPDMFGKMKDSAVERLLGLRDFIVGIPDTVRTAMGKAIKGIRSKIASIRENIGNMKDSIGESFSGIIDDLKKPFEWLWGKMKDIKDLVFSVTDSIGSKIGGLFGGNNKGSTTTNSVGTSVSGGVAQNFTLNINLSGMTDRSDKRVMAREMADLMQEEVARAMGGTTTSSRYV